MCMVKGRQDALVFDDPVPNIRVRTCTRSTLLKESGEREATSRQEQRIENQTKS